MKWLLFFIAMPTALLAEVYELSIEEAERLTLSNNPQIKTARAWLDAVHEGKKEEIAKWLPQISLISEGYRLQKPLKQLHLNKANAFETLLSLNQTVFSYPNLHRIRLSNLLIQQFEKVLQTIKNNLLFEVRTLYYLIALDYQKLKTAKEHVELLSFLADRMAKRESIGKSTSYHVNQAKVAMVNVTQYYFEAEKNLKNHLDQMAELLGLFPSETTIVLNNQEITTDRYPELTKKIELAKATFEEDSMIRSTFFAFERQLMGKIFSETDFRKWNLVAKTSKPELQLQYAYARSAEENIRLKKSEYWPTVHLIGNYGGSPSPYFFQPSTRFFNQEFEWGIGISVHWSLFDGGGRGHRVKRAQAEARATAQEVKKIQQKTEVEVREQLHSLEEALAKYLSSSANYKLAKETLEQAKNQLDIGYITIYDYLVSVDGQIRAKTNLNEGIYELLASYFALLHKTGESLHDSE